MHRSLFRYLLALWLVVFLSSLCAQVRTTDAAREPTDLRQLMDRAGLIFAGRVVAVKPVNLASSDQVASLQITVQVEQGIRGPSRGEQVIFREWAGLWSAGERYRVGQRLFLFLYPSSALGLTSPVGGSAGRFPIDESGRILLTPSQQQTIRGLPGPVRRVPSEGIALRDFARVLRGMGEE